MYLVAFLSFLIGVSYGQDKPMEGPYFQGDMLGVETSQSEVMFLTVTYPDPYFLRLIIFFVLIIKL